MTRTQAAPQQRAQQPPPPAQKNGADQTDAEKNAKLLDELLGKTTEYTPLAEAAPIKLSVTMVKQYLCVPTRTGKMPSDSDVIKFMTMCKQRALNPWAGDCYLLGYDSQDGPKFSIVVAIQALFKRAEINEAFDGIESGVVVIREGEDMEVIERAGDLTLPGETLIGGWAKVYRKDRAKPFYQRLKIATYRKKTPIWNQDPEGMVSKCAESGALRQAFPSEVGGLYLHEELMDMGKAVGDETRRQDSASAAKTLMDRMLPPKPPAEEVVGKASGLPQEPEGQNGATEAAQDRQEAPGEHDQTEAAGGRQPGDDEGEPNPGAEAAVESGPGTQPVMFGGK